MNRLLRLAAFPLSLALSIGSSHASTLAYQPIVNMSAGTVAPHYLAVGDFNADGKPDLAVPDFAGKTVSIYLNKGGASFGAPVITTLAIDNTVGAMVSGDFNEDGKADLAVATVSADQVVIVLLSNGDGTFAVQPPIPGSFGFLSGKVADFNGDGHADLFLGGNGSPYLFLGKGDGSFTQGSVGKGSFPGQYTGISAGDFNGDKKLDGIAADIGGNGVGSLDFFPGDGNSLGNATTVQPPFFQNPATLDVADLNNDGKLDLLLSGSGAAGGILGNGDGTFQLAANQLIPIYAEDAPPNATSADDVLVLAADFESRRSSGRRRHGRYHWPAIVVAQRWYRSISAHSEYSVHLPVRRPVLRRGCSGLQWRWFAGYRCVEREYQDGFVPALGEEPHQTNRGSHLLGWQCDRGVNADFQGGGHRRDNGRLGHGLRCWTEARRLHSKRLMVPPVLISTYPISAQAYIPSPWPTPVTQTMPQEHPLHSTSPLPTFSSPWGLHRKPSRQALPPVIRSR